ncbi:ABC transporter substrate-binding protein [Paracoccus sp. S1E-3]|uniref:ABC transporter substrate-binding protein n=1 Tax=Paracoccus sp. S1E-3 TaxID=2756130 RepID=UPI0015EF40DA|nr:ABC transporter substrate-binding protein [Paracoccus sp. S1E-3]MBA4491114.1 ABC transporter substrate-binding protein [Paracoccus sp. S1E-3]
MTFLRRFATVLALAAASFADTAVAQEKAINVGTLAGGTVMWELQVMQDLGIDRENGFDLQTTEFAGNPATQVAMQGGAVDAIVSDLLWVAQQRAAGSDFVFLPYSTAVGGVLVGADSPVQSLADLKGKKIGIAGGPVDKSWLILRAWNRKTNGEDLAAVTEQVFGAPPLIMQAALSGEVDGAINFWHFMAKMKAAGMREVISVSDAAKDLGLDPRTPLLGYVLSEAWIAENRDLAVAFAKAVGETKQKLGSDDAVWDELRPIMNAADDAEFVALRDGWRAGIPPSGPVDVAGADAMFKVMAELGGEELTGGLPALPEGLFWQP